MKFTCMIELAMDFLVIFLKVRIILLLKMFKIFVLFCKVCLLLFHHFLYCSSVALGWTKEKFIIIGHSFGAILGTLVRIVVDLCDDFFDSTSSMQHVIQKRSCALFLSTVYLDRKFHQRIFSDILAIESIAAFSFI